MKSAPFHEKRRRYASEVSVKDRDVNEKAGRMGPLRKSTTFTDKGSFWWDPLVSIQGVARSLELWKFLEDKGGIGSDSFNLMGT